LVLSTSVTKYDFQRIKTKTNEKKQPGMPVLAEKIPESLYSTDEENLLLFPAVVHELFNTPKQKEYNPLQEMETNASCQRKNPELSLSGFLYVYHRMDVWRM
jgi:hypothetical protein